MSREHVTPERLAEIEGFVADDQRKNLAEALWDTNIILDLIGHIRDLEARLAVAREALTSVTQYAWERRTWQEFREIHALTHAALVPIGNATPPPLPLVVAPPAEQGAMPL